MSQINLPRLLITAVLALALGGCGDKNDKAVFSPEGGHPSDWIITHKNAARASAESCRECHGERFDGGVSRVSCTSSSAVSGFTCHATSPVENMTGCVSCHGGAPSGPFGIVAPNRRSAHAKHTALAGVGCASCHLNAGVGTAGHGKASISGGNSNATVTLAPQFNANITAIPFGYNANGTCSNVSCHGGKTTPSWSGSIVITSGDNGICWKCHEQRTSSGAQQYNSYFSGNFAGTNLHTYHLGADVNAYCTDCHKISTLTNYQQHFSGIASNTFSAATYQTIGVGTPTKISSYVVSSKTCTADCHQFVSKVQNWIEAP